MSRKQLEDLVASIMDTIPEPGGTSDYVAHVRAHDGQLGHYSEELAERGLEELIRRLIRSERLPAHGNVRRFASVEVPTGKVDDDGEQITKRKYVPAQMLLFEDDDGPCNQVVDYHVNRVGYHKNEANRWVKQRRIATKGEYQRELPFPELDDDDAAAA